MTHTFTVMTLDTPAGKPDETWKNKLSPDQYYVLRMVSRTNEW